MQRHNKSPWFVNGPTGRVLSTHSVIGSAIADLILIAVDTAPAGTAGFCELTPEQVNPVVAATLGRSKRWVVTPVIRGGSSGVAGGVSFVRVQFSLIGADPAGGDHFGPRFVSPLLFLFSALLSLSFFFFCARVRQG
jgi:hypothetical protein